MWTKPLATSCAAALALGILALLVVGPVSRDAGGDGPSGSSVASSDPTSAAGGARVAARVAAGVAARAETGPTGRTGPGAGPGTDPGTGAGIGFGLLGLAATDGAGPTSEVPIVVVEGEQAGATSATGLPGLRRSSAVPLLRRVPARAQAGRSALVRGFPRVLRPADGSVLTSSSVAPGPGVAQVALTARSDVTVDDVLSQYRTRLRGIGMRDDASPAVAGSSALRFTRGRDVVVVTARPARTGTVYSVFGAVRTRVG